MAHTEPPQTPRAPKRTVHLHYTSMGFLKWVPFFLYEEVFWDIWE